MSALFRTKGLGEYVFLFPRPPTTFFPDTKPCFPPFLPQNLELSIQTIFSPLNEDSLTRPRLDDVRTLLAPRLPYLVSS